MAPGASPEQIESVARRAETLGLKAHPIPGEQRTAIGLTGNQGAIDPAACRRAARRAFSDLPPGRPLGDGGAPPSASCSSISSRIRRR